METSLWDSFHFEVTKQTNDTTTVKMNLQYFHERDLGIVHGGAICALIDTAMTELVEQYSVLANVKVNFFKPGDGEYLVAKACLLVNQGESSPMICEVFNDRHEKIAEATGYGLTLAAHNNGELNELFQFKRLPKETLPSHVYEQERKIPFNDFLGIRQTLWMPYCVEIELQMADSIKVNKCDIPTAPFSILVDVACGQALKTKLVPKEMGLTVELSVSILQKFSTARKLIARGLVRKKGRKIAIMNCVVLNEQQQLLAYGSATYFIKKRVDS